MGSSRAQGFYGALARLAVDFEDRFCTSSQGTQRLYFLAGHLNLDGTETEDWKFKVGSTGKVAVGGS